MSADRREVGGPLSLTLGGVDFIVQCRTDGTVSVSASEQSGGKPYRCFRCDTSDAIVTAASRCNLLAVATEGRNVKCFQVMCIEGNSVLHSTLRYEYAWLSSQPRLLAFSPCGRYLAAACYDELEHKASVDVLYFSTHDTDGAEGLQPLPLSRVSLPCGSASDFTSLEWSKGPTSGPAFRVDESMSAADSVSEEHQPHSPSLLITGQLDGTISIWREAPAWERTSAPAFTLTSCQVLPPGSSVCWLQRLIAHDRLHWAWDGGGSGRQATRRDREDSKAHGHKSAQQGKEALLVTLPPIPGESAFAAAKGPHISSNADPSSPAAFPLPRNIIGRTRAEKEGTNGSKESAVEDATPYPSSAAEVTDGSAATSCWPAFSAKSAPHSPIEQAALSAPPLSLHPSVRAVDCYVSVERANNPTGQKSIRLAMWCLSPAVGAQAPIRPAKAGSIDLDFHALLDQHADVMKLPQHYTVTSAVCTSAVSVTPVRTGGSAPPSFPLPLALNVSSGASSDGDADPLSTLRAVTGAPPSYPFGQRGQGGLSRRDGSSRLVIHQRSTSNGSSSPEGGSGSDGWGGLMGEGADAPLSLFGSASAVSNSDAVSSLQPRRDSLLLRVRSRRLTAVAGLTSETSPPPIGSGSAARLRTRAASALATAAAFDAMDWQQLCDSSDHLPPRLPFRSCTRGSCVTARTTQPPSDSHLTLNVCIHSEQDGGGHVTVVQARVHVEWATGRVRLLAAKEVHTDATATAASPGSAAAASSAGTSSTTSPPSPLLQHHPDFLTSCLRLGRPHVAAVVLSHMTLCVRKAKAWREALLAVEEIRGEAAAAEELRLIEGHFSANPSLSRRHRMVSGLGAAANSGESSGEASTSYAAVPSWAAADNATVDGDLAAYSTPAVLAVDIPALPLHMLLRPLPGNQVGPVAKDHDVPYGIGASSVLGAGGVLSSSGAEADADGVDSTGPASAPLRLWRAWHAAHPFATTVRPSPEQLTGALDARKTEEPYPPPLSCSDLKWLLDELPSLSFTGLGSADHLRLLAVVEVFQSLYASNDASEVEGLDAAGLHFLLAYRLFSVFRRVLSPAERATALAWSDCLYALHSQQQETLLRICLPPDSPVSWADIIALRIPLWLRSDAALRDLTERLAKSTYLSSGKDPMMAMLPYLALGTNKLSVLRGLFRLSPSHQKVFTFLSNDFSDERWKKAASKNAFALIAQHRYEPAAGFFLLAGRPGQAIKTATMQLHEPMMALLIARLAAGNAAGSASATGSGLRSLRGLASSPSSQSYCSIETQQLLKEASQVLLAAAKSGGTITIATISRPNPRLLSSASSSTADAPRSILGFGFADDADHDSSTYYPPKQSPVEVDDSTYYAPPSAATIGGRVGLLASTSTTTTTTGSASGSSFSSFPALSDWTRIDVDEDPVGYVMQHELRAAGVLACGGWPSGGATATATLPPAPPSDLSLGSDVIGGASLEWIAAVAQGRPLTGVCGLLVRLLAPPLAARTPSTDVQSVQTSVELLYYSQLLLSSSFFKQPTVRKAITARLHQEGVPGLTPLSSPSATPSTDAIDRLLRDTLVAALLTGGTPSLALEQAASLAPAAADTIAAVTSRPVKKTSLFADFDAPPPSAVTSAPALGSNNPVETAPLQRQLGAAVVAGHVIPFLHRTVSTQADWSIERSRLPASLIGNGVTHIVGMNGILGTELCFLRSLQQPTSSGGGCVVPSEELDPSSLLSAAMSHADWLAAFGAASLPSGDQRFGQIMQGYLRASTDAVASSCEGSSSIAGPLALTYSRISQPSPAQRAAITVHASLAAEGLRLQAAVSSILHSSSFVLSRLLTSMSHHAWVHLCLTSAIAGDWQRLLSLLTLPASTTTGVGSSGSSATSVTDHVLFATEIAAASVDASLSSLPSFDRQPPLEKWLSRYLNSGLTTLVATALAHLSARAEAQQLHQQWPLSGPLLSWRDRAVASFISGRVAAEGLGLSRHYGWDASSNRGPRSHVIAALTGVQSGETSASAAAAAWWQDSATLFELGPHADAASFSSPLVALWTWLGGPGLLWTVATERRALARAEARRLSGYLPDTPAHLKLELRTGKGYAPVLDLCAMVAPLMGAGGGKTALAAPSGPLLLAACHDMGVGHLDIKQQQAQPQRTPGQGAVASTAAAPTSGVNGAHNAAIRLQQGPSAAVPHHSHRNTIGHVPSAATYRKRFLG